MAEIGHNNTFAFGLRVHIQRLACTFVIRFAKVRRASASQQERAIEGKLV